MLDMIWKILGVLGIILLILLCVIVVLLLLVLFYPLSYRVAGMKNAEAISIKVKINWLFGLLRGRFYYPEPGKFVVKLLWFTLYDSEHTKDEDAGVSDKVTTMVTTEKESTVGEEQNKDSEIRKTVTETNANNNTKNNITDNTVDITMDTSAFDDTMAETSEKGIIGFITAKYEKIKYTILKIYDKIKHIWENFTFYRDLLKDEQTWMLLEHAIYRLKKILRNIRPRKLKADIIFGTGEPDTTGYALGVYSMFSPMLGKHVNVTPDFSQSILQGEFYMAGHITIFQVVFHSLMVVFDKRLALLKKRIENHKKQGI